MIDLVFPVRGAFLPTDHSYPLYAAISRLVPEFHAEDSPFRFAPITGIGTPDGRLQLHEHSALRIRTPDDRIRMVLPLAGKRLDIIDDSVRLGVPSVRTLNPAPSLIARLVTFKLDEITPDTFLATARAKLAEMGVTGEPQLPIHMAGDRAGEAKRRVVRIKGVQIVGYSLIVAELSAADSLKLQEQGLGGRTHMGCGFFAPVRKGGM
jgi:CRISPR-associated protein Cas6